MFDKVANKPELTKPSQIIDYLKKCDMIVRKNTVVPPTTQQPTTASVAQDQVAANSTYNTSVPNRSSARGQFNNYQGRGNFNNSAQNKSTSQNRKTTICIYCRKPNHEQEKCYSHIKDNQPCVTPKGTPYWQKCQCCYSPFC